MMLLQVEFMALIFVVVYVGAIAVLFLFVVMLRNLNSTQATRALWDPRRRPVWATLRRFMGRAEAVRAYSSSDWVRLETAAPALSRGAYVSWVDRLDPMTTLQTVGQVLYTHSFVYLLLAGFVLLVARIGAIVLTLKVRTFAISKRQHIHQQRSRDAERAIMKTRVVRDEGAYRV
jgi:NADH-quinone oxidoreductase subunit J